MKEAQHILQNIKQQNLRRDNWMGTLHMNRQISPQRHQDLKLIHHTVIMKTRIEQGEIYMTSATITGKMVIVSFERDKQTQVKTGNIISLKAMSQIITD